MLFELEVSEHVQERHRRWTTDCEIDMHGTCLSDGMRLGERLPSNGGRRLQTPAEDRATGQLASDILIVRDDIRMGTARSAVTIP